MNYKILLLLGKVLIIVTLALSTFTFWVIGFSEKVWLPIILFILHILVGMLLCIYASKHIRNEQEKQTSIYDTLIHPFFQIAKWSTIIALGFQLVAAIIIAFFYCLKRELETTLFVSVMSGAVIVAITKAVQYFQDNVDSPNQNCRCNHPEHEYQKSYIRSVGIFSQKPVLEVFIKTNDGRIPCFYIRDHEENGEYGSKLHACIRFQNSTYFNHEGAADILSTEQKTQLIEYLESGTGAYKNWHRLIDGWNCGNNNAMLPYNLEMPDYSTL